VLLEDANAFTRTRLALPLMSLDPALEREFAERVSDSSTLAFRVALGVLRNRHDAEDVAQEAFLRAHRSFASLRDRERFRAVRSAVPSVEEDAARREVRERVAAAVDALPEKLRIVTVLAAIQEQDVREVARLLELPEGTVKSRLHLARKALAESLRCLVNDTGTR
jgi:RNA polymerase sigma-70 factor (ECF subfamily)